MARACASPSAAPRWRITWTSRSTPSPGRSPACAGRRGPEAAVNAVRRDDAAGTIAPEFAPPDVLVIRYSEIFLKGENRRAFEDVLLRNVQRALVRVPAARGLSVRRHHARLVVEPDDATAPPAGGDGVAAASAPALPA